VTETTAPIAKDPRTSTAARIGWTILILATLYVCYFSHLGAIGFVGPDEPRYAWIARDMAETGDWVTPRLYGKPWFEKPPLFYWGAAISFKLFGVSEASARLPSAIVALLATLAAMAASAQADTLTLVQDTSNYSVGVGGAFIATPNSGPISNADYSGPAKLASGGFLTYCIEDNEFFYSGGTYNYALSNGAVNGGLNGQTAPNYDGVSNATAYLYSQFAQGILAGFGGFNYNLTGYGDLQQAIWFLEGEGGTNNALVAAAVAHEGANWNSDNNGAYGVLALNLTDTNGGPAQDQLYYHNVPDQGMTVALLGLSLLGLAGFRRKFFGAK